LPYLWRDGFLGGRTFDVLMTRLPLEELHARLDAAIALHPERTLLGDFRAPSALVAAEREALQAARRVITPHTLIAALFAERAVLLPWKLPTVSVPSTQSETLQTMRRTIVFPGPTTARKGAYEVREAARALDLEVLLLGRDLEGTDFWNGVRTRRITLADEEWKRAIAVVQPSLVEDCPRVLLAALAAGVPVITTAGSGLPEQDGVTLVPAFDTPALITALKQ
jgi:glycosyltransferase involved in cell wall biosynthesis